MAEDELSRYLIPSFLYLDGIEACNDTVLRLSRDDM